MSAKKKVLENSFFYIFSSLLVKAIGFLLLPIYTMFLTPNDYGVINLVNGFIQVANFIVAFSLYSAAIRFYADYKDNKEKLKNFYGTIITFILISGVIFFGIALIFKELVITWFFEGISFYPIILITLMSLMFVSLHRIHQSILQGMQQGKKLTKINITIFGITVLLNLFFIVVLKLGAVGFLMAQLIANIGYFIFMLLDLKKNELFVLKIDLNILREALKYSIPLMPHNLSTRIASLASRIFINKSSTLALVGLYSIGMQFGMLIDTIQSAVNKAFQPWFFEMMNKKDIDSRKEVVELSKVLLIIYSLIYMGIGLFSQEVVILMTNERYIMAWTVIPILVVAFSVKSIYYFYINILFYYKNATRKIFISTIAGSFSDILIAFLLIPKYGMYGAACAFLIAKIIVVSIVVLISKKYDDIGYRISKMLGIILPSLLFMGTGLYFSYTKFLTAFSWNNLVYKIIILTAYIIFIYFNNKKVIDNAIKTGKIKRILKISKKKNK